MKGQIPVAKDLMPRHIALIMDGNGRWAKIHNVPRKIGHREGAKAFNKIAEYAQTIGIEYLTVYAFSTENWKRSKEEVDALMSLLESYLEKLDEFAKKNIRLIVLGDMGPLSPSLVKKIKLAEEQSKNNTGMTVNIALNYGGRDELVNAVKKIATFCEKGELSSNDITEKMISENLYTGHQPDPDVIIRPSGEKRLSNFLLWQAAYAELVFMDVLWPDFSERDLDKAIVEYANRDRRFGGR